MIYMPNWINVRKKYPITASSGKEITKIGPPKSSEYWFLKHVGRENITIPGYREAEEFAGSTLGDSAYSLCVILLKEARGTGIYTKDRINHALDFGITRYAIGTENGEEKPCIINPYCIGIMQPGYSYVFSERRHMREDELDAFQGIFMKELGDFTEGLGFWESTKSRKKFLGNIIGDMDICVREAKAAKNSNRPW